ncbi:MAG: metallophosphoesterase [Odoribacter sp.]|nr:metallophosphoesterase [Odoribacter sp.]
MRSSNLIFLIAALFFVLTDSMLWFQLKQYLKRKWQISLYVFHTLFFIITSALFQYFIPHLKGPEGYFWIEKAIGIIILIYTPKLIFVLLNAIGLICRRWNIYAADRIKRFATVFSMGLFLLLLYSITWGRYNYKIENVTVPIENLPTAFQDFTIIQLADIHLGSYGESYQGIARLIEQVNAFHPDLIVFTGDMVNNFADEMNPWIKDFKTLKAKYGKYAVMGNHDYGDYTHWENPEDKNNNLKRFRENMKEMGFQMLNNDNVPIVRQKDTLWLAGVENWGKPPFPRYGRLIQALDSIPANRPIILLSHDPSHWRGEILNYPVSLTLAGHTHAMQLGIKIGKKEWSPAQYLYPEYDGLYQHENQYLHVSRGQGYLGFPGRIGLRPVITQIKLVSETKL